MENETKVESPYSTTKGSPKPIDWPTFLILTMRDIGVTIKDGGKDGKDRYNNTGTFNTVKDLTDFLESNIAYPDTEYIEAIETLKDESEESNGDRIKDINLQKTKYNAIIRQFARLGYIPSKDVITNSWIITRELINTIKRDDDASILVHGKKGSGKSTLAIALCMEISQQQNYPFTLQDNVYKDANKLREYISNKQPPRGTCFVYDDAGADKAMSRRRTATLENIEFNEILQTCRDLGYIIFYTSPSDVFISERSLMLFTHTIEPITKFIDERITLVKFKIGEPGKKEMLWKYLRNATGERVTTIRIQIPPYKILEEYKKFRRELSMDKMKTGKMKKAEDKEARRFKPYDYAKKIIEEGVDKVRGKRSISADRIKLFFEDKQDFKPIGGRKAETIKNAVKEILEKQGGEDEANNKPEGKT